ncbi:MAG: hypothetical protein R3A44_21990 [Caldilineaceae bacterium]
MLQNPGQIIMVSPDFYQAIKRFLIHVKRFGDDQPIAHNGRAAKAEVANPAAGQEIIGGNGAYGERITMDV